MINKIVKYLVILAIIGIGGFLFYNKIYIPKITYKTTLPKKGNISVKVFGIGNEGAKDIYSINAGVSAKVLSILTDEGKWVKKGDLLVVMDEVNLPELLKEAKLGVNKAKFDFIASQKELKGFLAQKSLALITFKRYDKLKKQSFVSKAEYDKAKSDLSQIKAQIEATKAHINSAKIGIKIAKKAVDSLQTRISRYKIYSPVSGFVISKNIQTHQAVLPNQTILEIVDPKTVWIKTYIDEKISADIKVGQKAIITLRSKQNKKLKGYVKRIVAQSDPVTLEREVDVAFDKLPIPFYINEQAQVVIITKQFKKLLRVPANLIVYKDEKPGIWIVKNNKAHFQNVKIIARGENYIGISGIKDNTKLLITSPGNKPLKEGMSLHL